MSTLTSPKVSMTRTHVLVFAVVLLCLALFAQPAEAKCPPGLSCKVCRGTADCNIISGLPRINSVGAITSPNLADYDIYKCLTSSYNPLGYRKAGNCSAITMSTFTKGFTKGRNSESTNISNYGFSIALYAALCFILFLTVLVIGICFAVRYCTCCCCDGGCCGSWYPTKKYGCCGDESCCKCCPCLGMDYDEATARWKYSNKSRWVTRVYVIVFILALISFVLVGFFKGSEGIKKSIQYTLTDAAQPGVELAAAVGNSFIELTQNVAGGPFVDTIRAINATIQSAIPFAAVLNATDFAVDVIENAFPDLGVVSTFVSDVNATVKNISSFFVSAPEALTSVNDGIAALTAEISVLNSSVYTSVDTIDSIKSELKSNFSADLQPIADAFASWQTPADGADHLADTITALLTSDVFPPDAPSGDLFGSGNDGTIPQFKADPSTLDNTMCNTLRTRAAALVTAYNGIRSGKAATLAEVKRVVAISDANADAASAAQFNKVGTTLNNSQSQFQAEASSVVVSVNDSRQVMLEALANISFTPMRDQLSELNWVMSNLPSISVFQVELDKILTLRQLFSPLDTLLGTVNSINETIYELPENVNVVSDIRVQLNDTLELFNAASAEFNATQASLNTAINITSLSAVIDSADSFRSALDVELRANFNITKLEETVSAATDAMVFPQDMQDALRTAETNAGNSKHDTGFSTKISSADTDLPALETALATFAQDVQWFQRGRCNEALTVACDVDGDCGTTCVNHLAGKCAISGVACTVSATCTGGGDYCVSDSARVDALETAIKAVSDNLNTASFLVARGRAEATAAGTTTNFNTLISDFGDVVDPITVDVGPLTSAIDSALNAISTTSFDPTATISNLESVFEDASSSIVDEINSKVADLQASYDDAQGHLNTTKDVQSLLHSFYTFTHDELNTYLGQISVANLQARRAANGTIDMIQAMLDVANQATTFFTDVPFINLDPRNYNASTTDQARLADVLTSGIDQTAGIVHMYMSYYYEDETIDPLSPEIIDGRIYRNAQGQRYVGNRKCWTDECIYAQIEYMWSGDSASVVLAEWKADSGMNVPAPSGVDVTIQTLAASLYAFPALVILLASLTLALACKSRIARWLQSCCASTTLGCIFCQLPFILLFIAFLFPMAMVFGDVCYSTESVIVTQYLPSVDVCAKFSGNYDSTTGYCNVVKDIPLGSNANINVTFDADGAVIAMLGTCSAATDGIARFTAALTDTFEGLPAENVPAVRKFLKDFRTPFVDAVVGVEDSWSEAFGLFGTSLQQAVTCKSVSNLYQGLKSSACCKVVDSFWWIASSWFLIAWSMILCGIPAMTVARKRLPYRPWGPYYRTLNQLQPDEDSGEFEDSVHRADEVQRARAEGQEPDGLIAMDALGPGSEAAFDADGNPIKPYPSLDVDPFAPVAGPGDTHMGGGAVAGAGQVAVLMPHSPAYAPVSPGSAAALGHGGGAGAGVGAGVSIEMAPIGYVNAGDAAGAYPPAPVGADHGYDPYGNGHADGGENGGFMRSNRVAQDPGNGQ